MANDQLVTNYKAFAKLYGYVKYFHPSDEAFKINWDKFSIYGTGEVSKALNTKELKLILKKLFLPIAPTLQILDKGQPPIPPSKHNDTSNLKILSWQHIGVGFYTAYGNKSVYQSHRGGNRILPKDGGLFIRQKKYLPKNTQFRISTYIKTQLPAEKSQVLFKTNFVSKSYKYESFNNAGKIDTKDWKFFTITDKLKEDRIFLITMVELKGRGKFWVKDLKIEIFKNNKWQTTHIPNTLFNISNSNKITTGWKKFGHYFGNSYKVSKVVGKKGINQSLEFQYLDDFKPGWLYSEHCQYGDTIAEPISNNLSISLPLALFAEKNGTLGHTQETLSQYKNLKQKLEAIDLKTINHEDKFLQAGNIINIWNVMQHFYPYFDVVKVNWEKELTNTLKENLRDKSELDFFYTLNKMLAKLQDGHAGLYKPKLFKDYAGFPIRVDWIEDQLVITATTRADILKCGDIILSMDKKPVKAVILNMEQYISGSPQWKRNIALSRFGFAPKDTSSTLKIKRKNQTIDVFVKRSRKLEFISNVYYKGFEQFNWKIVQPLGDNIYYVDVNKATMKDITPHLSTLAQAKGIVFDLRTYPETIDIISHLIDQPVACAKWNIPKIIYPDQKKSIGFNKSGRWLIHPQKPRFKGKMVFLTGKGAGSAAETFMGIIKYYKLAAIIGEPTGGKNGNVNIINLPGDYYVKWTGMKVLKYDDSQHHLIGILPTIPFKRTIKGVREGRDEYVERAIKLIKDK